MINQNAPKKRAKTGKSSHKSPLKPHLDKDDEYIKVSNAIVCALMNGGHKTSQLSEALHIPQRTIQRYIGEISKLHGTSASGEQIPIIRKNGQHWHTSPTGFYLWGCFVIDSGYELRLQTEGCTPETRQELQKVYRAIINTMSDCGTKYVPAYFD